jgi:fatty acid desaturase
MRANQSLLKKVQWRDLVELKPWEKAWELGLSLPWLALSLWCYDRGWWEVGALASFYFFLTGLRQSHNAQHYALGLPRLAQDFVLFLLSILMLTSMHAVQVTHLHHHRHCLDDQDAEGDVAHGKWWQAVALGPLFPFRLHFAAWRLGSPAKRRWMLLELTAITISLVAGLRLFAVTALQWHLTAMLVGECFTGFFAVWTVHHDCESDLESSRTQHSGWVNAVTYHMFMHLEHHLFPAVPTCHLPRLARRLRHAIPPGRQKEVLPMGRSECSRGAPAS